MRKLEVALVASLIVVVVFITSTVYFYEFGVLRENQYESLVTQTNTLHVQNELLKNEISDLEVQVEERYNEGYMEGLNARGFNIRDPTYTEAITFMTLDQTDQHEYDDETYTCWNYVADFKNNAFEVGYRCGDVAIEFPDSAHAIVCFNTTDYGIIFIEPQSDEIVNPKIGEQYWDRTQYEPLYDDTIVRIFIIW